VRQRSLRRLEGSCPSGSSRHHFYNRRILAGHSQSKALTAEVGADTTFVAKLVADVRISKRRELVWSRERVRPWPVCASCVGWIFCHCGQNQQSDFRPYESGS